MLEEVEGDPKPLKRCEEKIKEKAKHWQCNTEVQDLTHSRGGDWLISLEKRSYKAATGVRCDGLHPKSWNPSSARDAHNKHARRSFSINFEDSHELGRRIFFIFWKILRVLCGQFEHRRRVQFEGASRSRCRPSWPLSSGRNGAANFFALC